MHGWGQSDSSPQILKEFAENDVRIRTINDSNTSYGHKVNEGIRQACGKYISVLESDDMYLPDMLEKLYAVVQKYEPDFVNADYLEFWEADGKRYQVPVKMYPVQDYNRLLESRKHPEDMRQILRYWTGIFRRDFLLRNEIWMNESKGASFQDMSFWFLTGALAETSYHLNVPVYQYRTDNPFSSIYDLKKAVVIADEFDFLKRELERRNIDNSHIWRHFYTWKYNDFCGNLIRFNKEARSALFERCYLELETDRIYLEQNDGKAFSKNIKELLEKSRDDFQKEIEDRFQNLQIRKYRQEKLYCKLQNFKAVIFGCGAYGKSVLNQLYSVAERICCFTDNNQALWNTYLDDYEILPPEDAVKPRCLIYCR